MRRRKIHIHNRIPESVIHSNCCTSVQPSRRPAGTAVHNTSGRSRPAWEHKSGPVRRWAPERTLVPGHRWAPVRKRAVRPGRPVGISAGSLIDSRPTAGWCTSRSCCTNRSGRRVQRRSYVARCIPMTWKRSTEPAQSLLCGSSSYFPSLTNRAYSLILMKDRTKLGRLECCANATSFFFSNILMSYLHSFPRYVLYPYDSTAAQQLDDVLLDASIDHGNPTSGLSFTRGVNHVRLDRHRRQS